MVDNANTNKVNFPKLKAACIRNLSLFGVTCVVFLIIFLFVFTNLFRLIQNYLQNRSRVKKISKAVNRDDVVYKASLVPPPAETSEYKQVMKKITSIKNSHDAFNKSILESKRADALKGDLVDEKILSKEHDNY